MPPSISLWKKWPCWRPELTVSPPPRSGPSSRSLRHAPGGRRASTPPSGGSGRATSWTPTGHPFPLVWNLRQRDVSAVDRTAEYHEWAGGRKYRLDAGETLLGVRVFRGPERESNQVEIRQGDRLLATVTTAHPDQDMADVPWVRVRLADGPVTLACGATRLTPELRGGEETVVDLRLAP